MVKHGQILHVGNPLLEWQVRHCMSKTDNNDYLLLTKPKERWKKIDGLVALVMAVRGWRLSKLSGNKENTLENLDVKKWVKGFQDYE